MKDNIENNFFLDLSADTVLADKYIVVEHINTHSSYFDSYVCRSGEKSYIAKIYKDENYVRNNVLSKKLVDNGLVRIESYSQYNGFPLVLIDCYGGKSLDNYIISEKDVVDYLLPQLNSVLHYLHCNEVTHGRICPQSIIWNSGSKRVYLDDFYVNFPLEIAYIAPEIFDKVGNSSSDYYSLGITLFKLIFGYLPFDVDKLKDYQQIGNQEIVFPGSADVRIKDVIRALCYVNNDSFERWKYDEVDKWIKGMPVAFPGVSSVEFAEYEMPCYAFNGKKYYDIVSFTEDLAICWNEGKKELESGRLFEHFSRYYPKLSYYCAEAKGRADNGFDQSDLVYQELLYKLNPDLGIFCWRGLVLSDLKQLGKYVLDKLRRRDDEIEEVCLAILKYKLLSRYITHCISESKLYLYQANEVEKEYETLLINSKDVRKAYYLLGYRFSGESDFCFYGKTFNAVSEFAEFMHSKLLESYDKFRDICHMLIALDGSLDPQLEAWLEVVESSKLKLELTSSNRILRSRIFELDFSLKEGVSRKVNSCEYNVYFTDSREQVISDVRTVFAEKTGKKGSSYLIREIFTLRNQKFNKNEEYYLNVAEKDSEVIQEKVKFLIDISFDEDLDSNSSENEKDTPIVEKSTLSEEKEIVSIVNETTDMNLFKESIYTIEEAREIYLKIYPDNRVDGLIIDGDVKIFLEKRGYTVVDGFAVKGYENATEYFIAKFSELDILDMNPYIDRFGVDSINGALKTLLGRKEIIEFEPNQYLSVRKLYELGIRKKLLREYCDLVYEYGTNNRFFTAKSLLKSGLKSELDDLGFGEVFYESIINQDSRFARTKLNKTRIYSCKDKKFTAVDFIVEYVNSVEFIQVDLLINDLKDKFGIELTRNNLFVRIKETNLYYDKIMNYLYKDYETYYRDL